ncbi:hypothetical protein STEG23_032356 [Scotinomys teguina]
MDINTEPHSCIRVTNQVMALGSSPGLDITMTLDGKQGIYLNPFPTALASSNMPLSPAQELFSRPFSHFASLYSLTIMVPDCQGSYIRYPVNQTFTQQNQLRSINENSFMAGVTTT